MAIRASDLPEANVICDAILQRGVTSLMQNSRQWVISIRAISRTRSLYPGYGT